MVGFRLRNVIVTRVNEGDPCLETQYKLYMYCTYLSGESEQVDGVW
jgi:hypothetical protein